MEAIQAVEEVCRKWFDLDYEGKVFVKLLINPHLGSLPDQLEEKSFCLMKLNWETKNFAVLQLAFFGTSSKVRRDLVNQLRKILHPVKQDNFLYASPIVLSKSLRPILVRYEPPKLMQYFSSIPLAPAFQLLKSFLFSRRWVWHLHDPQSRILVQRVLITERLKHSFLLVNTPGVHSLIKV